MAQFIALGARNTRDFTEADFAPFLEEEAEIRRYILMFEHLRAAASGLDATAALLGDIAAEI